MENSIPNAPFFTINLAIGLFFIVCSIVTKIFPPKKINIWYGYRTPKSMKNEQNWGLAQYLCAVEMHKVGILLCIISLLGLIPFFSIYWQEILCIFPLFISIGIIIYRIEKKLE